MHGRSDEKRGKLINTPPILNATQAAFQPFPQSLSLNYENLFAIQRVRNPFTLGPVSFSALASYLECPWCMLIQKRKRRPKEPKNFTPVRQKTLFGKKLPDPRLVGTLLHTLVNLLHDEKGPLTEEQRLHFLTDQDALTHFIRRDLLTTLQNTEKMSLAMFLHEISYDRETLHTMITAPIVRYQRELAVSGATIFSAAERFQCKLLSTKDTFVEHPDRGGYVCLIGEFDQIRIHHSPSQKGGIPAIIEFKKGLGGKTPADPVLPDLFSEPSEEESVASIIQPTATHAMQLLTYWIAFQTRWDMSRQFKAAKGQLQVIPMSLHQPIELVLHNLQDGCQYQLCPSNQREALTALIECIFYLNWAMKSGYAWQSPEHQCKRAKLTELPAHAIQVQVGSTKLTGQECYLLAKSAFDRFKDTICWQTITR